MMGFLTFLPHSGFSENETRYSITGRSKILSRAAAASALLRVSIISAV